MEYFLSKTAARNNRKKMWESIRKYPRQELRMLLPGFQVKELYKLIEWSDLQGFGKVYNNWMNFGYWKTATTYEAACEALAYKLATFAELEAGDHLLDAGYGYGVQDIFWLEKFGPARIEGVNLDPEQVKIAQENVQNAGMTLQINLQEGSATQLPFEEASFDKVFALESAFHFKTRERFFQEAFRVLKPGGVLALADTLPAKQHPKDIWFWINGKRLCIPPANQYDKTRYQELLAKVGFTSIANEDISEYVLPAMAIFFEQKGSGIKREEIVINLAEETSGLERWWAERGWFYTFDEYHLFKAKKHLHE